MLKKNIHKVVNLFSHSTVILMAAVAVGSVAGVASPSTGELAGNFIDPTILTLVFLLLFEVPVKGFLKGVSNVKFIGIAWLMNFLVVPLVGFLVASIFISGESLFYTGLIIYFMAPCTDWYLGFTRLAKGNVELGAAILPINMVTQLVMFPVYLSVFDAVFTYNIELTALFEWFLKPLMMAVILRLLLNRWIDKLLPLCRVLIPLTLALLVFQIFAQNINHLMEHLAVVPWLLMAIFGFFMAVYWLVEVVAKITHMAYPEHCLLAFTTGARNAPLMLGLTTIAFPDQPLIYAGITIGMLLEFPHLTALKSVFLRRLKSGLCRGNSVPV